jgi:hypothetical protein
MTTKHTPGPWRVNPGANEVRGADWNVIVADVGSDADARLIAAAPDLLGMLELMAAQHFCGCRHPACNRCRDDDDCADVIAKAKGEKP